MVMNYTCIRLSDPTTIPHVSYPIALLKYLVLLNTRVTVATVTDEEEYARFYYWK